MSSTQHFRLAPDMYRLQEEARSPAPVQLADDRMLLSVVEAAQLLGIGRSLMYELLGSGQIRSVHIGRLHKVPAGALNDFVARLTAE